MLHQHTFSWSSDSEEEIVKMGRRNRRAGPYTPLSSMRQYHHNYEREIGGGRKRLDVMVM